MDDSEGQAALKVKAFKKRLEKDMYRCRVILQDERLTTVEAEEPMILAGIRDRRKRKEKLDQMAACVILQEWLDNHQDEIKEMTND
jgi:putative Holliday junction resolvase